MQVMKTMVKNKVEKISHFWALWPLRHLFYSFRTTKIQNLRRFDWKYFRLNAIRYCASSSLVTFLRLENGVYKGRLIENSKVHFGYNNGYVNGSTRLSMFFMVTTDLPRYRITNSFSEKLWSAFSLTTARTCIYKRNIKPRRINAIR